MKGYTLMELMLAVLLMAVLLVGGTSVFMNNLRSGSIGDMDASLNSSLRDILGTIERSIRFESIESVSTGATVRDREYCLSQNAYVLGENLNVVDDVGVLSKYYLNGTRVASLSAKTSDEVMISSPGIIVTNMSFTWYCNSGQNDKIIVSITASAIASGSGVLSPRSMQKTIEMINSGVN